MWMFQFFTEYVVSNKIWKTFSPSRFEINSSSHDVFTKTVLFALHLYAYTCMHVWSLSSTFELLPKILEFALPCLLPLTPILLLTLMLPSILKSIELEMSKTR